MKDAFGRSKKQTDIIICKRLLPDMNLTVNRSFFRLSILLLVDFRSSVLNFSVNENAGGKTEEEGQVEIKTGRKRVITFARIQRIEQAEQLASFVRMVMVIARIRNDELFENEKIQEEEKYTAPKSSKHNA